MLSVTFVAHDGNTVQIKAESGRSLMQEAVNHGVAGIIGECGGACACATCHCYIEDTWLNRIPDAAPGEMGMLECVNSLAANSRLSCQVKLTDELDGLIVRLPESQY